MAHLLGASPERVCKSIQLVSDERRITGDGLMIPFAMYIVT